ncbi:MAG TPA: collagenase-like protease [Lentisphaeria bacterium]|nr:MAG: collagenase [Lentisphaerae bacterium GWF2_50_93]HCE45102.1 collagenase-like protease [Lentisphaeria bacterium]
MEKKRKSIEITAPVGSWESLSAAIRAGADSVYFGVGKLNMRSRASENFTLKDLARISRICGRCGVKSYLALNTIIYDSDIPEMKKICDAAKSAGICAIIASDVSAIRYAGSIGIPVHISVQANVSNIEAVKFFAKFADVMVMARELDLGQIQYIIETIRKDRICGPSGELVRIELFVHGALCVSISGKCYMSLAAYNSSANRGDCYQPCRRKYLVKDEETGFEMAVENQYVMSPRDLCTIRILGQILDAGVSILKIEGRGRAPDYAYNVTEAYRKAVELWSRGKLTPGASRKLEDGLEAVFNRGFWHGGYYLGDKAGEWSGISGSKASKKKIHVGEILNYFHKPGIAEINLSAGDLETGDEILITGHTTGARKLKVKSLMMSGKSVDRAGKGHTATFPIDFKSRKNDKVYLLSDTGLE